MVKRTILRQSFQFLRPCTRHARYHSSVSHPSRVIFSGIQPTGVPHLGNYLGALRYWVQLQRDAQPSTKLLYSVVDLHAITVKQDPKLLDKWRSQMLATLIAIGLDPKRSILFYQCDVPAHSEMMWILNNNASFGYLERMTQWKNKMNLPDDASIEATKELKNGLFSYPVLQAADILVHGTTHVPVGADQQQHLEFARYLARSMNHHYGTTIVEPEIILSPVKRVKSLTNPIKKMSKSDPNPASRILLTDSRETVVKKVMGALTDSLPGVTYDPEKRPGISNLLQLMYYMGDELKASSIEELAKDCEALSIRAFKEKVADVIDEHLDEVRDKYEEVLWMDNGKRLEEIAEEGARKAAESAKPMMETVKEKVLGRKPWHVRI